MQEMQLRKGPWLEEEDEQLTAAVSALGDRRWDALAKESGLRRSGKSCRLRWMNYLQPNLKHGNITPEEESIIVELQEKWGNRWSKIARRLPGRTDNEIKNFWRSYLKRKAQAIERSALQEEHNQSINTTASQCSNSFGNTSSSSECGTNTTSPCSMNEDYLWFMNDNNVSEEMLNLTNSPHEARLTEWMSNCLPDDINYRRDFPKEEWWNFGQEGLITDEFSSNISVWDYPLWHEE